MPALSYRLRRGHGAARGTVILYHGFGATAEDLFSLADLLDPEGEWNVFCPQAPVPLRYGSETFGYAWFPERPDELQMAMTGRYFRGLPDMQPEGLVRGAETVLTSLHEQGLDSSLIIAAGFSQGAMMAVETAVQSRIDGLILYSGALIARDRYVERSDRLRGLSVLQSHGSADEILPIASGRDLRDMLEDAGARPDFHEFHGGHTIPETMIDATRGFLQSVSLRESSAER